VINTLLIIPSLRDNLGQKFFEVSLSVVPVARDRISLRYEPTRAIPIAKCFSTDTEKLSRFADPQQVVMPICFRLDGQHRFGRLRHRYGSSEIFI
jgi:hypothetical protein